MAHNPDRWLSTAAFFHPVYWALCTNEEDFRDECMHLNMQAHEVPAPLTHPTKSGATTHTFHNLDAGKVACIVYMPQTDRDVNEVHALLAHEAMHVYQTMLEELGETAPGHEFEAYTVQALCQALFDSWDEQTAPAPEPAKKPAGKTSATRVKL